MLLLTPTANAQAPITAPVEQPKTVQRSIGDLFPLLQAVIQCESGGDPKAKGDFSEKLQEYTSFGLVQIHLPAHPDITRAQAEDPEFAMAYLEKEVKAGRGNQWTCWRKMTNRLNS